MQNTFIKKLIALTLAGCLALSSFPVVAFSDGTEEMAIEAPAAEVIAEPVAEPAVEPTAEPAAEPVAEPAVEPTAEPAEVPVEEDIPLVSESVQTVQKLIDALPSASALSAEIMAAAYQQTEAAYIAYLALTADEQAQIIGAEKFTALFAMFNAQVATLEESAQTYKVTIINDGSGSVSLKGDKTSFAEGETVELNITANEGALLRRLILLDSNENLIAVLTTNSFVMPTQNVTVTAFFVHGYDFELNVNGAVDGKCSASLRNENYSDYYSGKKYVETGKQELVVSYDAAEYQVTCTATYGNGEPVSLTATTPEVNYFNEYTYPFTPTGDTVIRVTFTPKTSGYTITIDPNITNGTVTADKYTVEGVETVTLTIKPDEGYVLDTLTVNGNPVQPVTEDSYSFLVIGDTTVSASFKQANVTFKVKIGTNSAIEKTVENGTSFSSWYLSNVYGAGLSTSYWRVQRADGTNASGSTSNLGAIQNGDEYTQFAAKAYVSGQYVLQIFAECDVNELDNVSGYSYMISAGSLTVHHTIDGVAKSFALTSSKTKLSDFADGAQWCVNGKAVDMSSTVPLTATAYTTAQSYSVIIAASENGSVSANPASAYQGKPVTLTIAPEAGYSLSSLIVNGENVTASVSEGTYIFVMPVSDVTVTATFKVKTYTVTTTNTAITADKNSYEAGETVKLTNSLPMGTVLMKLSASYQKDGTTTAVDIDSDTLTFTVPAGDVDVTAETAAGYYIDIVTVNKPDGCTIAPAHGVSTAYNGRYYVAKDATAFFAVKDSGNNYDIKVTAKTSSGESVDVGGSVDLGIIIQGTPASDITLTVTFKKLYTVTLAEGSCVSFPKSTTSLVTDYWDFISGDTVTLNIKEPGAGTVIQQFNVQNTTKNEAVAFTTSDGKLTFTMPEGDVTVSATTEAGYYIDIVTVNAPEGCTITPYNNVSAAYGSRYYVSPEKGAIFFAVTCPDGYNYSASGVDADGNSVGVVIFTGRINIREKLTSDVTLSVTFTQVASPSYTITIPSSVSLNDAQSMIITASEVQNLAEGQSIDVAVTSENVGKLKNGDNEISYSFAQSMNFTDNGRQNLALTIGADEVVGKPAGTYTDTLNFSVSLTDAAVGE